MNQNDITLAIISALGGGGVVVTVMKYFMGEGKKTKADADSTTVDMALKFADASDKKARIVEEKLSAMRKDLKELEKDFEALEREYLAVLRLNAKYREAIKDLNPNHPLLKVHIAHNQK